MTLISHPADVANGFRALLMLIAANSAPWLLARLLGRRWALPLDLGLTLADGQRLLGAHKTWRGLAAGVIASASVGRLLGMEWWLGAGVGVLSLLGDAVSSAIKRRFRRLPGSEVPIVDQLPEALLPLLLLRGPLGLNAATIALVVLVFGVLDVASTRARHRRSMPGGGTRPVD
jgi:CDP-2,3-bis-(O-geranylgeranyl)-sn-glycerol synthase